MITPNLPPIPTADNMPAHAGHPPVMPPPILRVLLGLVVAVAGFDLCFWGLLPGQANLSVGVFALLLSGVILLHRHPQSWTLSTVVICVLILGSAFAPVLEASWSNLLVWLVLIPALAGDTYFRDLPEGWSRWIAQYFALLRAPGRLVWLGLGLIRLGLSQGQEFFLKIIVTVLLALPALILGLIFLLIFSAGNIIFGHELRQALIHVGVWLYEHANFARAVLWLVVGVVLLPLLVPATTNSRRWSWLGRLPRWPEVLPTAAAHGSTAFALIIFNLIFFAANGIDLFYLWGEQTLPAGYSYSEYVHKGVTALITSLLLSGVVLIVLFQQPLSVARRWDLKIFASLWILQNIVLLASVGLRLRKYIEAYQLTLVRCELALFLVLVGVGFALLAVKILREKSLTWLLFSGVLATFALFYVTQFLDLKGAVATYNVKQWLEQKTTQLDVTYLQSLGPDAWPALRELADSGRVRAEVDQATYALQIARAHEAQSPITRFDFQHWCQWSLRAWLKRKALE